MVTPSPFPPSLEPPWMISARSMLGMREIPGAKTAPFIADMLLRLKAWWTDDETPWCATFVATCLHDNGLSIPSAWYRASSYRDFGRAVSAPGFTRTATTTPPYGAIAVLERKGGGHVAFVVGVLKEDGGVYVYLLGGNQDNQVCVRRYALSRIVGWRWPADYNAPTARPGWPVMARLMENAKAGVSEA